MSTATLSFLTRLLLCRAAPDGAASSSAPTFAEAGRSVIGKMPTASEGFPSIPGKPRAAGSPVMQEGTAAGILAGRRALITGAAGGIGRAAAHVFAREGALVALVDVDERSTRQLAQELAAGFGRPPDEFTALRGEVTDAADVDRYMTMAADVMG